MEKIIVLIVEDDVIWQDKFKSILQENSQYNIFEFVYSGTLAETLDIISQRKPDCIILDLMLPDSTAQNTLEKVSSAVTKFVPIIITSVITNHEMMQKAYDIANVNDYISKAEFNSVILFHTLKQMVYRISSKYNIVIGDMQENTLKSLAILKQLEEKLKSLE